MRVIRSSLAIAAALLAGLGGAAPPVRPRVEPLAPPLPRRSGGYGSNGRPKLEPSLSRKRSQRPEPWRSEFRDPRSNGGGPKLQRKAAEGKL